MLTNGKVEAVTDISGIRWQVHGLTLHDLQKFADRFGPLEKIQEPTIQHAIALLALALHRSEYEVARDLTVSQAHRAFQAITRNAILGAPSERAADEPL
jgi:hypothetical protein